jgi:hypothetical protein
VGVGAARVRAGLTVVNTVVIGEAEGEAMSVEVGLGKLGLGGGTLEHVITTAVASERARNG